MSGSETDTTTPDTSAGVVDVDCNDEVEEFLASLDEDVKSSESTSQTKNKKKKKHTKIIKQEIHTEEDDSSHDKVDEDEECSESHTQDVVHNKPPRSSWAYTIFKLLFFMSCLTSLSGGIFVYHTVQNVPNSKLGKLFIKSGHFINELANILIEEKDMTVKDTENGDVSLESESVKAIEAETSARESKIKKKKTKKNKNKKNDADRDEDTSSETPSPQNEDTIGEMDIQGTIDSLVGMFSSFFNDDSLEGKKEGEIDDLNDRNNEEKDDEYEEEEEEEEEDDDDEPPVLEQANDDTIPSDGAAVDSAEWFIDIPNIVGMFLLVGSFVMRYRRTLFSLRDSLKKYLRKEKNRIFFRNIVGFVLVFCLFLVVGWFVLFKDIDNKSDNKTSASSSTPTRSTTPSIGFSFGAPTFITNGLGNLSLSDIIAIIIVILSLVLFATKQVKRSSKPLGSSYFSKFKSA